jgi:hypothetical protein
MKFKTWLKMGMETFSCLFSLSKKNISFGNESEMLLMEAICLGSVHA